MICNHLYPCYGMFCDNSHNAIKKTPVIILCCYVRFHVQYIHISCCDITSYVITLLLTPLLGMFIKKLPLCNEVLTFGCNELHIINMGYFLNKN
jgi:hypothetical protein